MQERLLAMTTTVVSEAIDVPCFGNKAVMLGLHALQLDEMVQGGDVG